jgi:predicted transposase YdaD
MIDADVSTFSGGADKVFRVRGTPDWLLHFEFQTGPDSTLPRRIRVYNALLDDRHDLMVHSVAVLLRPQADLANLTGLYQRQFAGEEPHLTFRYGLIRVWQLSAERLLSGGLGTLPLAPIGAVTRDELPGVVERLHERLRGQEQTPAAKDLWTATHVLLGLRYSEAVVNQLLRGVITMEDSVTYQEIVTEGLQQGLRQGLEQGLQQGLQKGRQEGVVQGLKTAVLLQGKDRFGEPDAQTSAELEALTDQARLEELVARLPGARDWRDLLRVPKPRRRKPSP